MKICSVAIPFSLLCLFALLELLLLLLDAVQRLSIIADS
jgi:hypothetical protein